MANDASPQRERQKVSAILSEAQRAASPARFYEFDRFRIDVKRRLLMRDGQPIAVKAKAFDTLLLLVQHRDRLLEKEELMNRLWPDTAVEEANLTQNIFEVRKVLSETAGDQRFIVTAARRGYRFVGEVREITEDEAERRHVRVEDPIAASSVVVAPRVWRRRRLIFAGAALALGLSTATAVLYVTHRRTANSAEQFRPPARTLTRLTYGAGLQTDVSWSPDGRRIAYAWDKDGNFDIWIQSVDGGEPTRLTSSAADDTQPAWSPDGERLVFRSEDDGGGLFAVNASGGPVRRIAPFGRRPTFMPNGRDVIFLDNDYPKAAFIVSADGGDAPRRILESELDRSIWGASAIHPDGRLSVIAAGFPVLESGFFVADRTNSRLSAIDISAAGPSGLLEPDAIRRITWNQSGTALFVEALSDGVPSLWRVPVDPVSLRWRTPERLTTGPASAERAAISPDGTRAAFTSSEVSTRAWLFPFDANAARLTGEGRAVTDEELSVAYLDLTADGNALYYGAREMGRNAVRLFRTDLTSGSTTFLAEAPGGTPSRTGRRVAYYLTRARSSSAAGEPTSAGREYALAVRDVDGRERLVSRWGPGAMIPQDWAQGDAAVLGCWIELANAGSAAVAVWPVGATVAAGPQRVLAATAGVNFWQPRYSPDFRWVSFVAQRMRNPGTVEIGIVAESSNRATTWTRIAADHVWPDKPRWSPDGRTLYILSRGSDGYFNVWGVPVDPARGVQRGRPFQITHLGSPRWRVDPYMDTAEMGIAEGRLVLPMQSVKGSIWLLSGVNK